MNHNLILKKVQLLLVPGGKVEILDFPPPV